MVAKKTLLLFLGSILNIRLVKHKEKKNVWVTAKEDTSKLIIEFFPSQDICGVYINGQALFEIKVSSMTIVPKRGRSVYSYILNKKLKYFVT